MGTLAQGGTYVSLVSPDHKQLTLIIETMTLQHSRCAYPTEDQPRNYSVKPQDATFRLEGTLKTIKSLHVWYSHLGETKAKSTLFQKLKNIIPRNHTFSLNLEPDCIYTITTVPSGRKGLHAKPPHTKPFPLPYADSYDAYTEYTEAFMFTPQIGSFEIRTSQDPKHGKVNRQTVMETPVYWYKQNSKLNASRTPITLGMYLVLVNMCTNAIHA